MARVEKTEEWRLWREGNTTRFMDESGLSHGMVLPDLLPDGDWMIYEPGTNNYMVITSEEYYSFNGSISFKTRYED